MDGETDSGVFSGQNSSALYSEAAFLGLWGTSESPVSFSKAWTVRPKAAALAPVQVTSEWFWSAEDTENQCQSHDWPL